MSERNIDARVAVLEEIAATTKQNAAGNPRRHPRPAQ